MLLLIVIPFATIYFGEENAAALVPHLIKLFHGKEFAGKV